MTAYLIRRVAYAIPVLVGVNVVVFLLFFFVNSPDDMARAHLGHKRITQAQIDQWKRERSLDLPYFYNGAQPHLVDRWSQTIFFQRSMQPLLFTYGISDDGKDIGKEIRRRLGPSLSITVPAFVLGLLINIFFAMGVAFYRGTYIDRWGVLLCVLLMSISVLFYIIGGQAVFAGSLRLVPLSGFAYGLSSLKFVALPIAIAIVAGLGGTVRFYRTIFLEELGKDYVRTARASGLPERSVLFVHVLKNAMLPILTGVLLSLPFLFAGSLLLESFFAIPGMGAYMIEAIARQDFAVVQALVSLGSFLYVVGLLLTDVSYTLVDPRVRFE